jgi:cellobiose-specific phosphotransferase system component IIA
VKAIDRKGRTLLFTEAEMGRIANTGPAQSLHFDVLDVADAEFFEHAEAKVVEALRSYAEKAQNGQRLQRRLFSQDAVRGFALVDLCHKPFDVVLMNPPFGEASKPSKPVLEKTYPRTKNDVYAAFVERGLHLLHSGGMLGAITSRTGFFLSSFQKWRDEILLGEATPTVLADLGYGVLDTAMVETAAYCVEAQRRRGGLRFSGC